MKSLITLYTFLHWSGYKAIDYHHCMSLPCVTLGKSNKRETKLSWFIGLVYGLKTNNINHGCGVISGLKKKIWFQSRMTVQKWYCCSWKMVSMTMMVRLKYSICTENIWSCCILQLLHRKRSINYLTWAQLNVIIFYIKLKLKEKNKWCTPTKHKRDNPQSSQIKRQHHAVALI